MAPPSLPQRVKTILIDEGAFLHVIYMAIYCTSFAVGLKRYSSDQDGRHLFPSSIAASALYPSTPSLHILCSFTGPLLYALWPPTVPARRKMMACDAATGVWRPKAEFKKQRWSWRIWIVEIPHSMTLLWAMCFAWRVRLDGE